MINTSTSDENLCGLKRTDFQKTVDGKQTDLFILKNENGVEIAVTNYGGAVLAIMAPDKNGKFANVIQGHDSIDHVINSHEPFLSTLIGRYGNRIANGKFLLDGQEYSLTINNGPNSLHGGPTGFHARVWDAEQVTPQSLKLHYLSADGEEGFPGNLDVTVVYTLSNQNEFIITYSAVTDKTTLVNLTHHGFFSLSGIANPTASVENNIVTINADFYTPMDNVSIPTGEIAKVEGTPMDFRTPHEVGERINDNFEQLIFGKGYDHTYILNKEDNELSYCARCSSPKTGIVMETYTTQPGVQLYTGKWMTGNFEGKNGQRYPERAALCLETQHFPDSPNKPEYPTTELRPGEVFQSTTIYKFSVE